MSPIPMDLGGDWALLRDSTFLCSTITFAVLMTYC